MLKWERMSYNKQNQGVNVQMLTAVSLEELWGDEERFEPQTQPSRSDYGTPSVSISALLY